MSKKAGITLALATALAAGLFIGLLMPSASFAQGDSQFPAPPPFGKHTGTEADKRLREEIVKEDAKKNIADASELLAVARDLQSEIAKEGAQYLSARAANDTKKIEKLAKNIRGRMNKDVRDIHF